MQCDKRHNGTTTEPSGGVCVSVVEGAVAVPGAKTTLTAGNCCQHANATLLTHTIDAKYNDDDEDDDGKLLAAYKFLLLNVETEWV